MGMGHTAPPGRRVWVLGAFCVEVAGRVAAIPHAGARALLAYLLLRPAAPQRREALVEQLWPEALPQSGRRALSDAIYRLRHALGPGWLLVDRLSLALAEPGALWVDAHAFQALAGREEPGALQAAVELYRGDLLPEIYADWAAAPRAALREQYLGAIERLGLHAEAAGRIDLALESFRRLVAAEPLREEGHRGMMRALARAGRHHEAIAHYRRLVGALQAEIGAEPLAETRDLAAQLRTELEAARPAAQGPIFVGRMAERATLLDLLDRAGAGRGGLAVIVGEAGIGKSRLLEELARSAIWRRWQVAVGQSEAFTHPPAYAPLHSALAAALPRPRLQQLAQQLAPFWLASLAQFVPLAAAPAPALPLTPVDPGRLATALRHILAALQRIAPHLILLDDVQWADPNLWALLDRLRLALADLGVVLVVSGRDDELQAQPEARAALAAWERAGVPLLRLAGLAPVELADLSRSYQGGPLSADQCAQLAAASGGNPLLALALLQAGPPDRLVERQSLDALLQRRLEALAPAARQALGAAAVLGYRFDYTLWQTLCGRQGLPAGELPAHAGALERAGMLYLEPAGYRFAHDTLRAYVYAQIGPDDRRRLHAAALATLQEHIPDASLALLYHAERAGQGDQVGRYALRAGAQALAGGTPREAAAYFRQALAALPEANRSDRFAALRGQAQAYDRLGEREAQAQAVADLQTLADGWGAAAPRAEAAWQRANLEWATGRFAAACAQAEAGLGLARAAADQRQEALLLELAGRAARDLGDYAEAHALFVAAHRCYQDLDDRYGAAWIDGMLGLVAQRQGRFAEAVAYQQRAVAAHHQGGDPYNELRAAIGLAIALWMRGDYLEARAVFERTLQISRQVDDRRIEEASLANLGALADTLGDYAAAITLKEQALALSRAADNRMGVAVGLCNLGITAYKLGRLADALAAFDEALAIDRATGRRHGAAYCLHGRGLTLAALGRRAEARAAIESARAIRAELAERDGLVASEGELAHIALADGDMVAAQASLAAALRALRPDDRADLRELVHYAAYSVLAALGDHAGAYDHLGRAVAALDELAGALPAEARGRLTAGDPLHRQVRAAAAGHARTREVRLARRDAPLGRALAADDYIVVRWTLAAPGDALLAEPARRRHILRRLLAEAAALGAAPTDADLAAALGVSRRTILRDMAGLAALGAAHSTRRRRRPAE